MLSNKKQISIHPWERTINHCYNDYQRAHNSINNPCIPEKKVFVPDKNQARFTIIGNRVVKEFIYCVHLVKTLRKYRPKTFDDPIIREATTVEWPKVWNELKLKYGCLAYCLDSQVAILLNNKFLGGQKELKEVLESRYHYSVILDYFKEGVDNFANYIKNSGRPCAYMHMLINEKYAGTMIFMLYADIVPYTCENFLRRCQTKKGGYGGTPVHRIVKDGWIQCGGFGLKDCDMDCENFIVPHDRRGVLCMANDGRHVDCSTQFFVLLQPAPWMSHKYVAFGQLIDGDSTLKAIESVPVHYESPEVDIIIQEAGILNLECQDIAINKKTNEYLEGHIEDLVLIGEIFYEELLEHVFLELELKRVALLAIEKGEVEEGDEDDEKEVNTSNIRATERFIRKKEDIEQLQKSQTYTSKASSTVSAIIQENNEFDVEVYNYETETETTYKRISLIPESERGTVEKPVKLFYLPLTNIPYPGEVDSTYDLKKFLRGDYCLESDLENNPPKKAFAKNLSYISEIYNFDFESDATSVESICSEDEQEIRRYLKLNVDRVSFAGGVIKNIARGVGKYNIFENARKSELITDEELRRFRLASMDHRARDAQDKKVSISIQATKKEPIKIKRRQTGFVRPEDLERIYLIHKTSSQDLERDDDDDDDESTTGLRKVRIAESAIATQTGSKPARRPTGFPRPSLISESDVDVRRKSALSRLYDNLSFDSDTGPTFKDYKPADKMGHKKFILTQSPMARMKEGEPKREHNLRASIAMEDSSLEQVLYLQHGRKAARKISSDYVKTIDQIERKWESSIRSVEYSKTRPSLTVSAYQQKNFKKLEAIKNAATTKKPSKKKPGSLPGLRLPGDTPLYSMSDVEVLQK